MAAGGGWEIDSSGRLIRISSNCDCNRARSAQLLWLAACVCEFDVTFDAECSLLCSADRTGSVGWLLGLHLRLIVSRSNRDHRQEIRQEAGDRRHQGCAAHNERNEGWSVDQSGSQSVSIDRLSDVPRRETDRGNEKKRPFVPLYSGSCSRFDLGEDEAVPP